MKIILKTLVKKISPYVPNYLLDYIYRYYFYIRYKNTFLENSHVYLHALKKMKGIEIGGPSYFFRAILPIYTVIENLDSVNFSNTTKWEGSISEGMTFEWYGNKVGRQFISECTELDTIEDDSYEFLISSNCLEHTANPIKALHEWLRIIRPEGLLLLVLPKKDNNFDNKRSITEFSHLIEDYEKNVGEDDMTHLEEILAKHDLTRDVNAGGYDSFKLTCLSNLSNREMHHHVFDIDLVKQIFKYLDIKLLQVDSTVSDNIFLGKKISSLY